MGGEVVKIHVDGGAVRAGGPDRSQSAGGGAGLTGLIAGPGIGAYANSQFWPLLPCFILIAASVALVAAAFQRLLGPLGRLVVATLFIVVGGSAAGGVTLLPDYGQHLGPSAWCATSSTSTATTSPHR
ncbi:hypothetical protein [Streptomyces sp. XY332]|uniref:hypothetical protein n=1 Tax=Streptomyces sp. XY332 TaxID=1415561 RepID=UPI000A99BAE7|nr:hypothetical protein [Streptomyces sp. XY332]